MKQKYLKNIVTLELDTEKCTGCGMCINVCPHNVFKMSNGKTEIAYKDHCMECGACAQNCPLGALKVCAGVGCAEAIIKGILTGSEPSCGCSDDGNGCC